MVPHEFRITSSGAMVTCLLYLVFPEFFTSDQIILATFNAIPVSGFLRQVTGENIRSNPIPSSIDTRATS